MSSLLNRITNTTARPPQWQWLRTVCVLTLLLSQAEAALAGLPDTELLKGNAMGTEWMVRFYHTEEIESQGVSVTDQTTKEIEQKIVAAIDRVEDQMSTWRPESEISRFNASRELEWFPVSVETVTVVQAAAETSRLSGGAFDATIDPLVRLWNFGPDPPKDKTPTSEQIETAMQQVGFENVEVRLSPPALRKKIPNVTIDLSAIAKGFGVDQVARLLEEQGIENYMVEIGGEVRTKGIGQHGVWRIGIAQPQQGMTAPLRLTVKPGSHSLATSGDYQNYYEVDGKRVSHTIDPRTGQPIEHGLASVSVIADDCMTADARATALSVLGPVEGFELASEQGWPVYMVVREGDHFVDKMTPEFERYIIQSAKMVAPSTADTSATTFVLAALIFGLAIGGMAIGVILSNRRIKGSCGGLAGMTDDKGNSICDGCTNPAESCLERVTAGAGAADSADVCNEADKPC